MIQYDSEKKGALRCGYEVPGMILLRDLH